MAHDDRALVAQYVVNDPAASPPGERENPHAKPVRSSTGGPRRLIQNCLEKESLGVAVPLVALLAALWATHRGFYSAYNLQSIAATSAIFAVVGLSQLAVLAIGQLNLALPAISVSCGMLLAYLSTTLGLSVVGSIVVVLVLGVLMGAIQGIPIGYAALNPFIITLGMASVYTGIMFVIAGTVTFPTVSSALANLGSDNILTIPDIAWLAVLVALIIGVFFRRTVSGREVLAVGASYRAAVFSAIPVGRRVVLAHALSGLMAAIAAVLSVANLAEVDTSLGQAWLLPSFVAPVLGGTLLAGGRITLIGTMLGALLLGLLQSALVVVGLSQYWYQVGLGIVLLLSVLAGQVRHRFATQHGT